MNIDNTSSGGNGFDDDGFGVSAPDPAAFARVYRDNGFQVVPAGVPGEQKAWKQPIVKWKPLQHKLVSTEEFDVWYGPWGRFANRPNMGMVCGACSGNVFIIDLDLYKSSAAATWWRAVVDTHMDPETVEQVTGGGGVQKLFRAPPGWVPPTCKTSIGVDIRGQGGFAMLPPSLHESGDSYRWREGCSPADLAVADAEPWLCDAIDQLVLKHGGTLKSGELNGPNGQTGQNGQMSGLSPLSLDAFGKHTDGRETIMRDLIWGAVVDWYRECPIKPSEQESKERAILKYNVYANQVSPQGNHPNPLGTTKTEALEREGRGPSSFMSKWHYAMNQWDTNVRDAAGQPAPSNNNSRRNTPGEDVWTKPTPKVEGFYPYLDIRQIKARQDPVWIVDGLIGERALGFIFGPPSSLKTFIALDLALCLAGGCLEWWGRKLSHHGVVVYLCREGTASLKFRIEAWERKWGLEADDYSFRLIEATINFMTEADVARLIATVQHLRESAGVDVSAIFVDTVSRVLPGADENMQGDMTMFVYACERLQEAFQCLVVGLHHTNKNGEFRGSTVMPGAGDFLIQVKREAPAMAGSLCVQKVKDGVDGMEIPFVVEKIEGLGMVGAHSSLVVGPAGDGVAAAGTEPRDGLPSADVCRDILAALGKAWDDGMSWCKAPQGSRPAVDMMDALWRVKPDAARRLLKQWVANGIVSYEVYDTRSGARGYRKTGVI